MSSSVSASQCLSSTQEEELLWQALWLEDVQERGCEVALFMLVVSNLVTIGRIAKCYRKKKASDQESDSVFNEAVGIFEEVCRSINRHDPELCLLEEFLSRCEQEMSTELERQKKYRKHVDEIKKHDIHVISAHQLIGKDGDTELLDTFHDPAQLSVPHEAYLNELKARIPLMLKEVLTDQTERKLVSMHYIEGMDLAEIVSVTGFVRERVVQKLNKAMRRLRAYARQYVSE